MLDCEKYNPGEAMVKQYLKDTGEPLLMYQRPMIIGRKELTSQPYEDSERKRLK